MTPTNVHSRWRQVARALHQDAIAKPSVHKQGAWKHRVWEHSVWEWQVPSDATSSTKVAAEAPLSIQLSVQAPSNTKLYTDAASSTKHKQRWSRDYGRRLRLTDLAIIVSVVGASASLRFGLDDPNEQNRYSPLGYLWLPLLIIVLWMIDLEISRSQEARVYGSGVLEYQRVIQSSVRVFGAVAILMLVFRIDASRGFVALALPPGIVLLMGSRWLWRKWLVKQRRAGNYLSDVVVVGSPANAEYVVNQLRSNLGAGYRVAGAALSLLDHDMRFSSPWYHIPVLSAIEDIANVVAVTRAEAVVVAGPLPGGPEAIQQLGWQLEGLSTELVLASNLTNIAGPRVHFRPVEGLPLMQVKLAQFSGGKHVIKRVMDVILSTSALLVLLPVFVALSLIVRMDSPGSAFFHQVRVGRDGEPFKMFKFRSMVVDAEARLTDVEVANEGKGLLFKMANDPRVTRCGSWMRKYSLDELPQFWNVLLGNMSLVGPRPPLSSEVEKYEKPTGRRLLIKPGITGLWQVSGRSDLEWDEAVRLDLYYVENWSVMGDLVILWRTFRAVSSPVGAY